MDTNVALWCLASPRQLSNPARNVVEDSGQIVHFSSISVVEFELKRDRLLSQYKDLAREFSRQLAAQGFDALAFDAEDAAGLSAVRPNRDPFDRMLSSQAIHRKLTLITADKELQDYEALQTLW